MIKKLAVVGLVVLLSACNDNVPLLEVEDGGNDLPFVEPKGVTNLNPKDAFDLIKTRLSHRNEEGIFF